MLGGLAGRLVREHRRPLDRRLGESDRLADPRVVDEVAEVLAQDLVGLARVRDALVVHGRQDPDDLDARVQVLAHHRERVLELHEPAQREVLGLHRHDDAGRRDERVDRQQAERRRSVDRGCSRSRSLIGASAFSSARSRPIWLDERHVGAGQVDRRDGDVDLARLDHLVDRHAVDEHVEHRPLDRVRVQPLRHGQVALRVEVDEQHLEALLRERDAEVQGRRRLRDAALLVRERDHLRFAQGQPRSQGERWDAEGGARDPCGGQFGSPQLIPSASSRSFEPRPTRPPVALGARPRLGLRHERPQLGEQLPGRARPSASAARSSALDPPQPLRAAVPLRPFHDASAGSCDVSVPPCERTAPRTQATRSTHDGRGRRPSSVSSSAATSSTRSPCSSVSTSARRTASRASRPSRSARSPSSSSPRSARLLAEQHGSAHRCGPRRRPRRRAGTSSASRTCAERNGSSEKSDSSQRSSASPSSRSVVGERQPLAQIGGEPGADRVEARRARRAAASPRSEAAARSRSGRKSSRSKTTGPAAIAPAVASRSARDRVGQLGGRVRRIDLVRLELAPQLEHEQPVDVAAELGRHQPLRLGPQLRDLAGHDRAQRDPAAEVGVVRGREPDDRRERDVGARAAEERLLEIRVRRVERLVLPVEAAAALSRPREHRQRGSSGRARRRRSRRCPACARAKIAAAGSRFRSSIALRASGRRRSVGDCSSTKPRRAAGTRRATARRGSCAPRTRTAPARRARPRTRPGRSRAGTRRGAVRGASHTRAITRARGSSPAWQPGHQYAIRLSSPCPHDLIGVPQRGHGRPTRR